MGSAARYRPIDLGREFGRIIPPARRDFSGFRYWTAEDVEEIRRTLERRRTPEPSAA
jgi:hypothetical protein